MSDKFYHNSWTKHSGFGCNVTVIAPNSPKAEANGVFCATLRRMEISQQQLSDACEKSGINRGLADALWVHLGATKPAHPSRAHFQLIHVAYYFGALVVIGAMGWFMVNAWEAMSGWSIAAIALAYGVGFFLLAAKFWDDPETHIVGGLFATISVCITPLAVYGVERATGLWPANDPGGFTRFHPYIHGSWVVMEIVTCLVGALMLRRFAFPFLTAPIAYALWYMSMDVTQLITGRYWAWEEEAIISVAFGAVMLLLGYTLDHREGRDSEFDFGYWAYMFGTLTFWGGLSAMDSNSEVGKFFYLLVNLAMIVASTLLRRRVLLVFGAIGSFAYIGHLSYSVFRDSVAFPFVLTVIGIGIVYAAVKYQRHQAAIDTAVRGVFMRKISP
jgi:hypothetical protein